MAARRLLKTNLKLIKYFLASLTVPEDEMWVNLSPYEKDRIIPLAFGTTEMGRDLLAQDYILKQLTASLMYPKRNWAVTWKNLPEGLQQYGTTEIPMNTFGRSGLCPSRRWCTARQTRVCGQESFESDVGK